MIPFWSQNPTLAAAVLATFLPFIAFLLIMVFTRRHPRLSAGVSIAAVTASLLCAVWLLARHWGMAAAIQHAGRWLVSSDITIPFGYLLDPVSLLMLAI
ncbi:MAG: hypothetical protein JSW26_11880, partial [Desulfobacterales bacterium]